MKLRDIQASFDELAKQVDDMAAKYRGGRGERDVETCTMLSFISQQIRFEKATLANKIISEMEVEVKQ